MSAAAHDSCPVVSIILPTYNGMPYLREAVASVQAQTFPDWELIVIDDGSTDDSLAWLESMDDPRLHIIRSEHTGHRAQLRNRGIAAARAEWIAFLDADDRWAPNKLKRQLAYHAEHPALEWSYTGRHLIDAEGRTRQHPKHRPFQPHSGWILRPLLTLDATIALPSVIVRRRLLERAGGFADQRWGEDYELWLRLAQQSQCGLIDEPLTEVRSHLSTSAGRPEVPRAYVEIHRRIAATAADPIDRRIAREQQARHGVRLGQNLISRRDYAGAVKALTNAIRAQPSNHSAWLWLARCVASFGRHTLLPHQQR
jgi:glycosyltransferase involved in cell wall biosynthesis